MCEYSIIIRNKEMGNVSNMKNGYYLFLSAIVISCVLPIMEANAKGKSCVAGEFLFSTKCRACPVGCYCTGGDLYSLDPDNNLNNTSLAQFCAGSLSECYTGNSKLTQDKSEYSDWTWGKCGRQDAAHIWRCPDGYTSPEKAKDILDCYKQCTPPGGNQKLPYKKITCNKGYYLPYRKTECASCKSFAGKVCPETIDVYPDCSKNQGLKDCPAGEKPNADATACEKETPAVQESPKAPETTQEPVNCTGNTIMNSSNDGCTSCPNGYEPNTDHTECVEKAPEMISVPAGKYLPANRTTIADCPQTSNKYCPGGEFFPASKTQGLLDCPLNGTSNTTKTACTVKITKDQMQYGPGGKETPEASQCWLQKDPAKFQACVFGIKIVED